MAAQSAAMQHQAAFQHPQSGGFAPSTFDSSPSPVQGFYAGPPVTQATHQQAFLGQYHGVNGSTTMGAGGNMAMMMPAGGQAQFQAQSSAQFSQLAPAYAPSAPAQQFQQQDSRTSASPQPLQSPNAGSRPASKQQTPPARYPMAAPPLPQTPANPAPQGQQFPAPTAGAGNAALSPKSPQSPQSQGREQQRIALLFEVNVDLIQEVQRLQSEGFGGAISPQQAMQLRNDGRPDKMASDEYIQCMRRLQANLAYLMPKVQSDPSKVLPGPAHMTPPPHMPQLLPLYDRMKELFPGWPGLDHWSASMSSSSPQANGVAT